MEKRFEQYKDNINKMLRYATLRSEVIKNMGLTGKLGIAILFFEYSRLYKDNLYSLYAEELLDEILKKLTPQILTIPKGLAGIAWGIVYLHRRKFIDGNLCEILSNVDVHLEESFQEAPKDILSYLAYRDNAFYNEELYSEENILDIIWDNWVYEVSKF